MTNLFVSYNSQSYRIPLLSLVVYLISLFPYVGFRFFETDIQPVSSLSLIILFVYQCFKFSPFPISRNEFFILLLSLLAIAVTLILSLASPLAFTFPMFSRFILSFLPIPLFYIFYNRLISNHFYSTYKFLLFSNYVWILGGFLQYIFPNILDLFVFVRSTSSRGTTSFGVEPSNFGFQLLTFSIILFFIRLRFSGFNISPSFLSSKGMFSFTILVNLLSIILLARSSLTIIQILFFLVVLTFCYLLKLLVSLRFRFRPLISKFSVSFILLFLASIFFAIPRLLLSRSWYLVQRIQSLSGLDSILLFDLSANARLSHFFYSFYCSFKDFFFPHSLQDFISCSSENFFFDRLISAPPSSYKIMSWTGDYLFTFGFFGLLIVGSFMFFSIRSSSKIGFIYSVIIFCYLLFVLSTSVPLANPIVILLFSVSAFTPRLSSS